MFCKDPRYKYSETDDCGSHVNLARRRGPTLADGGRRVPTLAIRVSGGGRCECWRDLRPERHTQKSSVPVLGRPKRPSEYLSGAGVSTGGTYGWNGHTQKSSISVPDGRNDHQYLSWAGVRARGTYGWNGPVTHDYGTVFAPACVWHVLGRFSRSDAQLFPLATWQILLATC